MQEGRNAFPDCFKDPGRSKRISMNKQNRKKFTKYVTLGWWLSFAFMVAQVVLISIFNLAATPTLGVLVFSSFVMLSLSGNYDHENEFSPYRGLKRLFKKIRH